MKKYQLVLIFVLASMSLFSQTPLIPSEVLSVNVEVNFNLSVDEIASSRNYAYVIVDMTSKNFISEKRTGVFFEDVKIFRFNRNAYADEILHALDSLGYRPANINELHALTQKNMTIRRMLPIVGLGTIWNASIDGSHVATLNEADLRCSLGHLMLDAQWYTTDSFAAIRK